MAQTKTINRLIARAVIFVMAITSMTTVSFATAPAKESVKYEGSGVVEVDFTTDVSYKKTKVTVKDSSGKKYKATITSKGDDEIRFKINKYKTGKRYNFVIKGVKKYGTKKYGKVKGSVKIPKKKGSISWKKAKELAIAHAKKWYKVFKYWDVEVERDTYRGESVWEVTFDALRKYKNKTVEAEYEYYYRISDGSYRGSEEEIDD